MTAVLKLGGSVITEKDEPETVDTAALSAAASLSPNRQSGRISSSFTAAGASATTTPPITVSARPRGPTTWTAYRPSTARCVGSTPLSSMNSLAGSSGCPDPPVLGGHTRRDSDLSLPTAQVTTLLDEGFVPVLHGDLVAHAGAGATVLSGDELVVELAPAVDADRVGVCSTVPGVLDEDGTVIDRIETFEAVASALGGSDATDVSGGMAGKVRALLALSAPAVVFGPDALPAFLAGESPGTTIAGDDDW